MIHNISYRLMVYGTEDEEKVLEALRNVIPGATPEREKAEGYHGNPITVLMGRLDRRRPSENSWMNSERSSGAAWTNLRTGSTRTVTFSFGWTSRRP